MTRDNFTKPTLDALAKRVGMKCSNPGCEQVTCGPAQKPTETMNIGVGAHITAASEGGPRFDKTLTAEQRRSIENAIWLCQNCAKLIDSDEDRYSVPVLREWKTLAESSALTALESPNGETSTDAVPRNDNRTLETQRRLESPLAGSDNKILQELANIKDLLAERALHVNPTVSDSAGIHSVLDQQIDGYRDLIIAGKPGTARQLLERLWNTLPANIEPRILFRVKANIAAAISHFKGQEQKAGSIYLEACDLAPDAPKAMAMRTCGLFLSHKYQEAYDFGTSHLSQARDSNEKAAIVSNLISGCQHLEINPLPLISEDIAGELNVILAKVDYLRATKDLSWRHEARKGIRLFPENDTMKRFSADASLDEAFSWSDSNGRNPLPEDEKRSLRDAVSVLQSLWDKQTHDEGGWNGNLISLSVNLASGYRLLNDYAETKRIINEALRNAPDDALVQELVLKVAIEDSDYTTAYPMLAKLPLSRDTLLGSVQIFANTGKWQEIIELSTREKWPELETGDAAFVKCVLTLAKLKQGALDNPKEECNSILNEFSNQINVPILLHQIAVEIGDAAWASDLYRCAMGKKAAYMTRSERFMLARVADKEEDADAIIDLLNGYVSLEEDSEDLALLMRAFTHANVQQSAVEFIKQLSPALLQKKLYAIGSGNIHYNRGALAQAEQAFRAALVLDPNDAATHTSLIQTLLRRDRPALVKEHLEKINIGALTGNAVHIMGVCQFMLAFDRTAEALELGYKIALENGDNLRVLQLYLGLFLPDGGDERIPETTDVVSENCWVQIQNEAGRTRAILIENGPDRPSIDRYSLSHPLSKALLGLRKDEQTEIDSRRGIGEKWRVTEIKHKYGALFQEILDSLPLKFPDASGVYVIRTRGDDITPILDEVKNLSEKTHSVFHLYWNDNLPLQFAARLCGRTSIPFASEVVSQGHFIKTCIGNIQEREAAIALARAAKSRGIVLDTYTAWVAYRLKIIPLLKQLFSRAIIPQSSLDEMYLWRERYQTARPGGFTVAYKDGQYIREEITVEAIAHSLDIINVAIAEFTKELEVLPAAAPASLTEMQEKILEIGGYTFFDAVYVAVAEDLPLLSDDLFYRIAAKEQHGTEGTWIQAALLMAIEEGLLSEGEYSDLACELARHGHRHVSLKAHTLMDIVSEAEEKGFERFEILAKFLGTEDADVNSHFSVMWAFLISLWNSDLKDSIRMPATSIILGKLAGMFTKHKIFKSIFYRILAFAANNSPELYNYIVIWLRGHFIDLYAMPD